MKKSKIFENAYYSRCKNKRIISMLVNIDERIHDTKALSELVIIIK
jgi:hypothetical protein